MGTKVAIGAALPDLSFDGENEDGEPASIHLRDYAGDGRLLVVRVQGGAWCGTCNWQADHTREIFAGAREGHVRVLDLVVGDRENAHATARDAVAWRAALDIDDHVAVGADPSFAFEPLLAGALPLIAIVDTHTMRVRTALSNPNPNMLRNAIDAALDLPLESDEPLVDGLFHRNEWDMISAIHVPDAPPPDPTNAVADDPRAIALGKSLFDDTQLSPAHVACTSCHDPKKNFADDRAVAMGIALGERHTPRIALAAFSPRQFWDGRADSLWAQALIPLENKVEMGSSRALVANRIATAYRTQFESIFPGALDEADRGDATRAFVDTGKAIAAYERSLRVAPTALDAYARGDFSALPFLQKQGLAMFAREGCMQCHWGPGLTDNAFHVTRIPTGRADGIADEGRAGAAFGKGAFKTPSLRGVANAHFFGHGGAIHSLDAMIATYGNGGDQSARSIGVREPWLPRFGETTRWSIAQLLGTLH